MRKLLLIFNLSFLIFHLSLAQDQLKLDSLNQALETAKHDTVKIKTLLKIGEQYQKNNFDTALFFYQKALKFAQSKSEKTFIAKTYNSIGVVYMHKGDNDKALKYYLKAIKLNKEIKNKSGIAFNYTDLGILYWNQSNFDKALEYGFKAIKIYKEIDNKSRIAITYGNLGNVYVRLGNYDKALEYYLKALNFCEKIGNKKSIGINLGNIGVIYNYQRNYDKALEYDFKAIKILEKIGDKLDVANNLGNIGNVYNAQGNNEKALKYYFKAKKIQEELGKKSGIAINIECIGIIYYNQSNYKKALNYYLQALKIFEEIDDNSNTAIILGNIADLYSKLKQYNKSIEYSTKSIKILKETRTLWPQKNAYANLSESYIRLGNYKKALEYKDKWIEINDSIFNTEKTKALTEMNTKYESEKKEKQIIQQQAELKTSKLEAEKEKAEKERQQTQRNMFIIAFALMIILAGFVFRSYKQKKKANILLAEQKQQIAETNEELNQQNEEITAQRDEIQAQKDTVTKQKEKIEKIHHEISQSIDYATRLQGAILPETKILDKYLSEHFVLFKPKDKVSGDFYWWSHVENHTVITAADSTGHGVPGAFMSMLGSSFLREIVQKEYITHTGVILRKLRKEIVKSLKQKGEPGEQKDGMDMAIISIDHKTNIVQYSGANNPLYIITNDELRIINKESSSFIKLCDNLKLSIKNSKLLYEIKPDKMPIAIYEKMDNFITHEIQLQKGDQLYMFSDGYADQFGGPTPGGKKFKYKPFKRMFLENADKSMSEQKVILEKAFNDWIKDYEQIDDVTVVGIKL